MLNEVVIMKKVSILSIFSVLLLSIQSSAHHEMKRVSYAESGWADKACQPEQGADGLVVDLEDDMTVEELRALELETGVSLKSTFAGDAGRRVVVRGTDAQLEKVRQRLKGSEFVESVEPNVYYSAYDLMPDSLSAGEVEAFRPTPFKPNDPMYKSQWHFDMIGMSQAWAQANGEGVIVAVIDTGVSPGTLENGKKSKYALMPDLDADRFVPGYDFVAKKADPSDGNGHGTHVAGTIAQSTNNGEGVAGIAYKAKIMPIKVLSDRGFGSVAAIAAGIRYAADNGAKVINMSLGGGMYSQTMARAVKYAYDKGVFVACAAGNGAREKVEYPAAYKGAFAVSSVGPDGKLAFYSSYGKELFISAPGGDTRVDMNGDGIPDGVLQNTVARNDPTKHGYFPFQGTSMATPHVAGVAALVVSLGVDDPDAIGKVLASTVTKRDAFNKYGHGLLNAAGAVKKAKSQSAGLSFLLGLGLAGLGYMRNRRQRIVTYTKATFSPISFVTLISISGVLGWLGVSGFKPLGASALTWLPGLSFEHSALWLSALVPLAFCVAVSSRTRLHGIASMISFGWAGVLLSHAMLGDVNVGYVPGHGLLDALWLTVNGVTAYQFGRIMMRSTKERSVYSRGS